MLTDAETGISIRFVSQWSPSAGLLGDYVDCLVEPSQLAAALKAGAVEVLPSIPGHQHQAELRHGQLVILCGCQLPDGHIVRSLCP